MINEGTIDIDCVNGLHFGKCVVYNSTGRY